MATQTVQPLKIPVQIFGNRVGVKFRDSLRELGVVHMYKREGKFYTFDIPFRLKVSKNGDKIIVMINKSNLPRQYPSQYLVEAKDQLEASLGMPIQFLEAKDVLAVCCQVSIGSLMTTAA